MKLGIYCRISRLKEEGKDRSIENQKKLGIDHAKKYKMPYEIYIDEGLSGASDKVEDRPSFQRLLNEIAARDITAVWAFDQSRFERNPNIRFIVNKLFKDCDIEYYTHMDGLVDLHDPQAELFGDMQSIFNKYQVTLTKIKVKNVLKQRVEEGKAHGILPYGYKRDTKGFLIIDKDEAKIVKRIYELSLKGIGTRTIANTLTKEGIPTRYNKIGKGTMTVENKYTKVKTTKDKISINWSGNTIRNIIINTIYKGERNYGGAVITVPAIIDPQHWKRVNENLAKNANNTGKKVEYRYLLKGLITCGVCGRNMYGRARETKKDNFYMCSSKRLSSGGCGNRSINIDKLDNFIWENLFVQNDFITRVKNELKFNKSKTQKVQDAIADENKILAKLKQERSNAINLQVKGLITPNEFTTIVKRLNSSTHEAEMKIKDHEKKLLTVTEGREIVSKIENEYLHYTKTTSFEQKKNVVNDLIKSITIDFVNDQHYEITIVYKGDLGKENWKTPDNRANNFYRIEEDKKGNKRVIVRAPAPVNNPEDKTNMQTFLNDVGDFTTVYDGKYRKTKKRKTK